MIRIILWTTLILVALSYFRYPLFPKLMQLFKNPYLAKKLGAAGRILVERKYSWKRILERLNEIVNQGVIQ